MLHLKGKSVTNFFVLRVTAGFLHTSSPQSPAWLSSGQAEATVHSLTRLTKDLQAQSPFLP